MHALEKAGTPRIVPLHHIFTSPGLYCMSYDFDLDPLMASLGNIGMIHRPWVTRGKGDHWEVVTGFRRILALVRLNRQLSPVIDVSDSGASPVELFRAHLYDNIATRRLNAIEKAMVLDHLAAWLPLEEISRQYMPLLNLPPRLELLNCFRELLKLEDSAKTWFARKGVSLKMMELLANKEGAEATSAVLGWMGKLKLNINYQYEFFELIIEITSREGLSTRQLLTEEPYSAFMESREATVSHRTKSVLNALKMRRFPRLFKAEELFSKNISDISLPEGVKVDHSPYFENPEYRMTITYRSGEELREKLLRLSRLENMEKMVVSWEDVPL